jgi:PAS domain S-box-containing protein
LPEPERARGDDHGDEDLSRAVVSTPELAETAEELYEDAPCGYLSTSADGTILRANRTFCTLSGYDAGELVGRMRFYDLLPPGAKIYYETHYAPLLQMQLSVSELAFEIVRRDERRVPVLVNAVLKPGAHGEAATVRVTVFDASERRRYERELLRARTDAEARAAAASALDHIAEGVVVVDDEGAVVVLNAAASRLFELAEAEVAGRVLSAVVPDWSSLAQRVSVGRHDAPAEPVVVPLVVGGETRWLAASAESAASGIVYTLRDVTSERRLADVRDDIVAIVSHELRTPLTGVLGAAQTLIGLGPQLSEEQRLELTQLVAEQAGRLARIVDEILLTQRLDSGDVAFDRSSFELGARVREVAARSASWRSTRPVEVASQDDVEVEGDARHFEQILENVLDNAVKYSPCDAVVRIRLERLGSTARVVVADKGPGVPAADAERIFQRFLRLDPSHASGATGTGLGLYIARELARRMHGEVGLLRGAGAEGAEFFIELPLARAG